MKSVHGDPGVVLFAGRFGSGKTEAAIAYALHLAEGGQARIAGATHGPAQGAGDTGLPSTAQAATTVVLVDLDIVTPYFRSRDTMQALRLRGVEVIAPAAVAQHLDTPAITPQILGAIEQTQRPAVVDVGGDRQGARALSQFSSAIAQRGYTMHLVVNPNRPFTDSAAGLAASIAEIEASSRLRVTSLVSNPNLMGETTVDGILAGHRQVEEFAAQLGLPVALVCIERRWASQLQSNHFGCPVLILDRFLTHPWEGPSAAAPGWWIQRP